MIRHYINTSIKQLRRHPSFSLINLAGLATAMAVCLMIFLYVYRELSFDRFHEEARQIYRMSIHVDIQGDVMEEPFTAAPVGPDLVTHLPEVTNMARLQGPHGVDLWQGDRYTSVSQSFYADSTFFEVFSFPLLRGDPRRVLAEPYSLVLTESMAEQLFPNQDPVGQLVRIDEEQRKYQVTGIAADPPPNNHLPFQLLRSFSTYLETTLSNVHRWDSGISNFTYVVLRPDTDMDALMAKTVELADEKINYQFEGMNVYFSLRYFPLIDIRLRSPFSREITEAGTLWKVWLFSMVALFVLFIAGFNFVNLCIAQSGRRAREIGMRKVLGASKPSLRRQFLLETIFITGISFLVALLLVEAGLPLFNRMLGTELKLFALPWWGFLLAVALLVGFFGLLASIYPAWYMSSFQPVSILKGHFWQRPGGFQPRNLLLIIQFTISMALIVCTLVIYLQNRHMQSRDLGFDMGGLISVHCWSYEDAELLQQRMADYPWVSALTLSYTQPVNHAYMEGVTVEGMEPGFMSHRQWADREYFNTLGVTLKEGRFFEREDGLEAHHIVVNETFVRRAGWTDPIGQTAERDGIDFRVVGVVHDYHFRSLHHEVEPLMVNVTGIRGDYHIRWFLSIRIEGVSHADALLALRQEWDALFPHSTMQHYTPTEYMAAEYATERSFGKLFLTFTLLAIIIAMLGVLGLSSFAAQQQQKETGIRKVLGASSQSILLRMSAGFLKWVALAAFLALPIAWWYMDNWLSGFPYAIDFPHWTMVVSVAGMLLIALAVVASQSLRAVRRNPAEVLATE